MTLEMKELKKNFTVRLRPDMIKNIDLLAKKYNQPKSYVIEFAITKILVEEGIISEK
jgi:predicted transcriptional regulator